MKKIIEETENNNEQIHKTGTLYIVSTPIGNDEDITLRALRVLKMSDFVVCEEGKVGARMLHKLNLNVKMELLNEQNEIEKTGDMLALLEDGKTLSIVSDAGTPVFADPGLNLVREAIKRNIKVVVVPGASSIMTAIVRSGFRIDQFVYSGFLSRDNKVRLQQLKNLRNETRTNVLLETPYRMMPLLKACFETMPERNAYIGCNLTMPFESHHYGSFADLYAKFSEMKFKGEFVVCFEGVSGYEPEIPVTQEDEHESTDRPERRFERREPRDNERGGYDRSRRRFEGERSGDSRGPRRTGSYGGGRTGGYQGDRRPRRDDDRRTEDTQGERKERSFEGERSGESRGPRRTGSYGGGRTSGYQGDRRPRRDDNRRNDEFRGERKDRSFDRKDRSDSGESPGREYRKRDDSGAPPRREYRKRDDSGAPPRREYRKRDDSFKGRSNRDWDNDNKGSGKRDFGDSGKPGGSRPPRKFGDKPFGKSYGKSSGKRYDKDKGKPRRKNPRD